MARDGRLANRQCARRNLFLSRFGRQLDKSGLFYKLRAYQRRANIKKHITTHTFRHTLASEMLKGGADLRHIQELLGHENLTTTQRYLHVVKADLKKVHGRTHPREAATRARLPRRITTGRGNERPPLVELYRQHLDARWLTPSTVQARVITSSGSSGGCAVPICATATFEQLRDYHEHLTRRKKPDGSLLSPGYRNSQVHAVQGFYAFLKTRKKILIDPFADFPELRKPRQLPKGVLTDAQVGRWMAQPDLSTPTGFRDRTLMEILYSCGLRGLELCRLTAYEIDVKDRTVRVVLGKGKKDRIVPIGKVAVAFLTEYLESIRPILLARNRNRSADRLFLTDRGGPLVPNVLRTYLMAHRDAARLPRATAVHSLRHACATEMLKGGATVRHVQEMLGHASLLTTQVYTRVVPSDLQGPRVHRPQRAPPRDRRSRLRTPRFARPQKPSPLLIRSRSNSFPAVIFMPVRTLPLYLDTSVIGGYFDDEFEEATRELWRQKEAGRFRLRPPR